MLEIDGSHGEGGGQLLRNAVALSAITGKGARISAIRARRDKPGLAPQHLTAVKAVAAVSRAEVAGLELRSTCVEFRPGRLAGGDFEFDVGTAGSVSLVLQALLPVLLRASGPATVILRGGTDVRAAPPLDYLAHVLLPLVARMGGRVSITDVRRGYYPRGGGEVLLRTHPAHLGPLRISSPGRILAVTGISHVAHLPEHIPQRMGQAAMQSLAGLAVLPRIETRVLGDAEAVGQGGAVVLWADREHSVLGAGRVAERGVPAEGLGGDAGRELARDIDQGAGLDVHAADQVLIYCALARGLSTFTVGALSSHAETTLWLLSRFLRLRCEIADEGDLKRVTLEPM